MKKLLVVVFTVVGISILALFGFTRVSAQSGTPEPDDNRGRMGGYGMHAFDSDDEGAMHDLMMTAWSEKLNLTVDELESRLDSGESMSDIALSTGMTLVQFRTAQVEIHASVIEKALSEGLIDSGQAEWMQGRSQRMNGARFGGRAGCACSS